MPVGSADGRQLLKATALAADHLMQQARLGLPGYQQVRAVELTLSEDDYGQLLATLCPRLRRGDDSRRLQRLTAALAGLGGTVTDGFADGRLSFSLAMARSRN